MRSTCSTIPKITVARVADGTRVTCSACPFDEVRMWRATADVLAMEHIKSHGGWR